MRQRKILGLVATCCGAVAVVASTPAGNLIVGSWSSGATPESDLVLDVTPTEVTFGKCTSPYAIVRQERSAHRPYELSDLVGAQFELLLHRFDRSGRIGESQFDENGDGEHLKQPATTHEMPSNSK